MNKIELIKDLKKKKKAVILAHYYTEDEIQKNSRLYRRFLFFK